MSVCAESITGRIICFIVLGIRYYGTERLKVALDVMGGDNAPGAMVAGALEAVSEKIELSVCLVGRKGLIEEN